MPAADFSESEAEGLIALAERLAEAARAEIRPHYRGALSIEDKPDATPVTAIDRGTEATLRRLVEETRPADGLVGEEYGPAREDADFVWVFDPIDGTKRFITGNPLFGTLIALLHEGQPLLGVVDMPILNERWIGFIGRPTFRRDAQGLRPVHCRPCPDLAQAAMGACSPDMFRGADAEAFARVKAAVKFPLFGGDCFNYAMIADGHMDLVVEADLGVYDYLAQVPILTGAGGAICDWQGRPLGLGSGQHVVAAGDPALIEPTLALLAAA